MEKKVRILVVDDTIVYRQILSNIVSDLKNVELAGTAPNGMVALSKIKLSLPDAVLLDVSMPVLDGIETLKRIKKEYPEIDVIMVSGMSADNADLTMKALDLGALDFIPKPREVSLEENAEFLKSQLAPLMSLVRTRKISRQTRRISRDGTGSEVSVAAPPPPVRGTAVAEPVEREIPEPRVKRKAGKIDVIALGVSTGGPNALQQIIPKLDGSLRVPILAVQHMPPMFTASLAERLNRDSEITVVEGKDGERVEAGTMYIAPGGHHMVVRKARQGEVVLGIVDSPPVNSCRPAVDVLFRSIAMVYGGNVLTVILTGMGNDGAAGVAAIRRKGGYSIVQDEATSVVWGMPQAVVAANEMDEILSLDRIAERIMEITR